MSYILIKCVILQSCIKLSSKNSPQTFLPIANKTKLTLILAKIYYICNCFNEQHIEGFFFFYINSMKSAFCFKGLFP